VHRERTGAGQCVEVPMLETITGFWLAEHLFNGSYVPPRGDMGYARVLSPERKPYKTRDGYICALVYNEKNWRAFVEKIERPDLLADPKFTTQAARANNQVGIMQLLAEVLPRHTTAEWLAFFDAADIPAMPVNDLEDLADDPHLEATGFFTERQHPSEGPIVTTASPFDFSATPTEYRRHAPLLGADGREVLGEAGLNSSEIADLERDGALRVATAAQQKTR
jgi:formyl-CoA transferase